MYKCHGGDHSKWSNFMFQNKDFPIHPPLCHGSVPSPLSFRWSVCSFCFLSAKTSVRWVASRITVSPSAERLPGWLEHVGTFLDFFPKQTMQTRWSYKGKGGWNHETKGGSSATASWWIASSMVANPVVVYIYILYIHMHMHINIHIIYIYNMQPCKQNNWNEHPPLSASRHATLVWSWHPNQMNLNLTSCAHWLFKSMNCCKGKPTGTT